MISFNSIKGSKHVGKTSIVYELTEYGKTSVKEQLFVISLIKDVWLDLMYTCRLPLYEKTTPPYDI